MIGINILVDMLMLKSEKLQYISGMAIIALTKENFPNQRLIVKGGGIPPLVRLLRATSTPHKVREGLLNSAQMEGGGGGGGVTTIH